MLVTERRLWLIRHETLNHLPNQTSSYFAFFFFTFFSSCHFWSATYTVTAAIRESKNEAAQSRSRNMRYKKKLWRSKDIEAWGEFLQFPSRDNEQTNVNLNWRQRKKDNEKESWEYFYWGRKDFCWVKKGSNNKPLLQQKDQTQVILAFCFYLLQMQTLSLDKIFT